MRRIDLFASLALLGFVAVMVLVVIPREHAGGVWHGLSPYFYPMVMLAGVALSSVGLLVQALTKPGAYVDQPNPITWSELGFFLLAFAIILAGVLVIHWQGTWIGGPLLIAAIMLFMGERQPLRIALVGLLTVGVFHAIVTYGLKIPLP